MPDRQHDSSTPPAADPQTPVHAGVELEAHARAASDRLDRRIRLRRRIAGVLTVEAARLEAEAADLRRRAASMEASADRLLTERQAEADDQHRRTYGPPVCLCPVSEAPGQPRTHRAGCPHFVDLEATR